MSGSGAHHSSSNHHGRGGGGGGGPSTRSFEDRSAAKEAMMQSVRDSSQQERRVYVGNLSYDVKWHHLKDFMRQGIFFPAALSDSFSRLGLIYHTKHQPEKSSSQMYSYYRMECRRWAHEEYGCFGFFLVCFYGNMD